MTAVDTGNVYERTRREFISTIVGLQPDQLLRGVPATPAWSVVNVFAHVIGLAADLNAQRFPPPDDIGGTLWTHAQVSARQTSSVVEMVAEWDREAALFEDGLRAFGYEFGSHFVADLHAHYQDVRQALGLDPYQDQLTVAVALDHYVGFVDGFLTTSGWGTLDIVSETVTRRLGTVGRHTAQVTAEPFEVLRSLSGRRSAKQIRALNWHGDVEGVLEQLQLGFNGSYSLPAIDLID